ncbi:MAG: hypothetical protein FWD12_05230 [Alphaproteobacteria bacterium]|nr:hypothetical protein [Alphaproteobacteria bacterium]
MASQNELLAREPHLAMLMGALPVPNNHSFGFGDDYGYGFGIVSSFDPSMNIGLPGFGYGFGAVPTGPAASPGSPLDAQIASGVQAAAIGVPPPPPVPMAVPPIPPGHPMMWHPHFAMMHPAIAPHAMTQGMLPHHPSHPWHPHHHAHVAHAWDMHNPSSTAARTVLLDPNRDSTVKVQRYSFSFSPPHRPDLRPPGSFKLDHPQPIPSFTQQPSTSLKPHRILMNAPAPGFVLVDTLQIANVNVFVGTDEDAYTYNAGAFGVMLDLPRLDPQNRATASGRYTGFVPSGFNVGDSFTFIITMQGPATLAGGYGQ